MENEKENDLIVRDFLARQRTTLANDRTLLSYIRTALYFLVSGTALFQVKELDHVRNLGYLAFALSIIFLLVGIVNYFKVKKRLQKGHYQKM
ncbi:MAG: putative membrane protein [Algoriphagus marincola HL-49]|uniref:Putative membrane protein n=1 Tax=Algoriphagus marincola HL-49 TaxID=1305737 RepID=A0A0P7XST0_9BACT|nr:MAG: putative membrane protein [Algoriphagus marincola HL-49]